MHISNVAQAHLAIGLFVVKQPFLAAIRFSVTVAGAPGAATEGAPRIVYGDGAVSAPVAILQACSFSSPMITPCAAAWSAKSRSAVTTRSKHASGSTVRQ